MTQDKLTDWRDVPAINDKPGYSFFAKPIQKPDLDESEYRLIRLKNGILALLIHDSCADKAAACLSIAVGHLQDPDDVPGMAHFCEHMIQKGSVPYPAESDFGAFINANGGVRNAGTSAAFQDYWFSINPSQLTTALSRLAACFHSPLFTASLTSREIYAVDSENKRNLQNDPRRIHQLGKALSNQGHPWTKFGTGNVKSLTDTAQKKHGVPVPLPGEGDGDGGPIGREVRQRLLKWWEEEYCAGRMTLCVLGNESLEELTDTVVSLFSPVPNRGLPTRPVFTNPVWGPEQKGTIVFAKTVKDYHAFSLTFQIDDQAPLYHTRPAEYLSHFVGHEGPGSICAYLKKRGWLLDLSSSSGKKNRSVTPFVVEGKLTQEGYLHYEDVVLTIFNYLSLLRSSKLDAFHFDEIMQLSATKFRFRERTQPQIYVRGVSLEMLDSLAPHEILTGGALAREWDEVAVRKLLDDLRVENARVMLMARDHDPRVVGEGVEWSAEKWYGTEYRVVRMPDALVQRANKPNENSEIFLPKPNPYVPKKLDVTRREVQEPAVRPRLLRNTALSTLWYKGDDQFWVPKAEVKIAIKSPVAYSTPRNAVLSRLLVDLVEDALSETIYDAELAGLNYSISNTSTGISVEIGGYDDKLPVLLDFVVERLKNISFQPDRLKVKAEQLGRTYKNFYLGQPSNLAQDFTSFALSAVVWTPEEKLEELPFVTVDALQWHKQEIFNKVHVEMLVTGNVSEKRATKILGAVEAHLTSRPLPAFEWPQDRSLLLPPGSNHVLKKTHANPEEMNSALTYYCQFGDVGDAPLRATLRLLVHILKIPAFTQLRTVEQLGYIVATTMWSSTGSIGLGFKLQSLKSPVFLESRVEAFISDHRVKLAAIEVSSFDSQKNALVEKLLERPKNLAEEAEALWRRIDFGYYDFLQNVTDASTIKTLTLQHIFDVWDKYLAPGSTIRKKLSLHLESQQLTPDVESGSRTWVTIADEALFKASLLCSSAAVPLKGALASRL